MSRALRNFEKNGRGLLADQAGGAVVEFAVISVVLVLLLMWSHVFFDIIQVRMKLMEEVRTAAFEMTAYTLSDYNRGTQTDHDNLFNDALDHVKTDVNAIYNKDLDSSYKYKKQQIALKRLTLDTLTIQDVNVKNDTGLDQSLWGLLNWFSSVPTFQSFNRKGYVQATASARFTSRFAPTDFAFGTAIVRNPLIKSMTQTLYLMVDSWKLEDGCSVNPDGTYMQNGATGACATWAGSGDPTISESLLHKEVGRLTFGGVGFVKPQGFDSFQGSFQSGLMNPLTTRTASVIFRADGINSGGIGDLGKEGTDGMTHLDVSEGEKAFFTAPFCTNGTGGLGSTCTGPYQQAYNARGDYFMGCPKAEAGKKDSQGQGQTNSYGECQYNAVTP